jgi:hypothetical protein
VKTCFALSIAPQDASFTHSAQETRFSQSIYRLCSFSVNHPNSRRRSLFSRIFSLDADSVLILAWTRKVPLSILAAMPPPLLMCLAAVQRCCCGCLGWLVLGRCLYRAHSTRGSLTERFVLHSVAWIPSDISVTKFLRRIHLSMCVGRLDQLVHIECAGRIAFFVLLTSPPSSPLDLG